MKEEITETLEKFQTQIDFLNNSIDKKQEARVSWYRANKKEIKKLLPKRGEMFKVIDNSKLGYQYRDMQEDLLFKVTDVRFYPARTFGRLDGELTTKGHVLDGNLKTLTTWSAEEVSINNLEAITKGDELAKYSTRITKVYVMIDKNTGYYKIGRSKNPERRERTLQSEKPTIEMLFNHDARVKDEKVLHDMFKEQRIRGEWFDLNGSDLAKIREYFNN